MPTPCTRLNPSFIPEASTPVPVSPPPPFQKNAPRSPVQALFAPAHGARSGEGSAGEGKPAGSSPRVGLGGYFKGSIIEDYCKWYLKSRLSDRVALRVLLLPGFGAGFLEVILGGV